MTWPTSPDLTQVPAYAFRPAVGTDLPLLLRWLRTPEVLRWWGDAEEQEALLREDFARARHGDAHRLIR
jgi:hypothetical protein